MRDKEIIYNRIKSEGILPLFYHDDTEVCIAVTKALFKANISIIEFTNRGKNAIKNLQAIIKERDSSMPGLHIGVGTVTNADEANLFIELGADFLVSPFFDESVNKAAVKAKVPYFPGCMTPREIHLAAAAGCTIIKLFPGNVLGPAFVEAIRPLFNNIDFIVTGGVETNQENIASWFQSGVSAVGLGSKLITKNILANKDYNSLTEVAVSVKALINQIKNNNR
ncbi:bifunctional 4-hydroxy-2-oxoglutarate aldolase/2-dehydro-3-deoxy-phosphogluconate aldolase [Flavobacterium alkalisoli]|uniref:Bifunctional 4-hydroxy-2-oxoglutarate aldolase/2-dehydro-3-deoxy-phosphogluconate aldolase n=1 Tax=Flavobacterium alkalisoli TaxID=2602769 RepID=A0A5B9FVP3_9FLAO|nr:bifunctional 4-hydroxy-2-oxoglutarate aldolase/2-dehydro-3-deoxy-phosphogluconate aldolase [Flavobacterium alkalisoli]QEE50985.1 bifunctional 4-hydroxy-2-oxoglutarate aldolase/2-dehydro-3-deoxy-phosphogluconate aldolase [Flavobacterium alkalisoli]